MKQQLNRWAEQTELHAFQSERVLLDAKRDLFVALKGLSASSSQF